MSEIKTISILGCGWYGFPLAQKLIENGFNVKVSSTTDAKLGQYREAGLKPFIVKFEPESEAYTPDFFKCDLLIISIPPKRSTNEAALFPAKINRVKTAILQNGIKRVIFISSTSVYGDCNKDVDEQELPNPDTASGKAMLDAERILNDPAYKLTIVRFGGLIGPGRDPARFFSGKMNIPNGEAPVNLIHLDDCIGLTEAIINYHAFGMILNACSPSHPAKMDFYTKAALTSGLDAPGFIKELKNWKIVSSEYAAKTLGYNFIQI